MRPETPQPAPGSIRPPTLTAATTEFEAAMWASDPTPPTVERDFDLAIDTVVRGLDPTFSSQAEAIEHAQKLTERARGVNVDVSVGVGAVGPARAGSPDS